MKQTKKITILHSNDLHGDFLAEQVDEKLVGGVSMLSGYIEKVRAEQPNTIYVIAGDMFRGSVIDSEYKGLSTIEIMNALAPDVVTIGNHEVDYGIAHLLFIEKCARFPIINANLYIKNTPTRLFTPYKILRVDGMNILFIGIITQDVINQTKRSGGRVICVGTPSCRTIESWAAEDGTMTASAGWTDIFIYPGYRFKVLDGLITNFHLPESTLIMLVSALAGREHVLAAYQEAVKERYHFFSFGDAMLIV